MKNTTIRGDKKGKSSGGAVEADDTLRSRAYARVIDAISEGEIEGLVDGSKSIYLDGTPIQASDGSFNFESVTVDFRNGTQGQPHLEGYPSIQNETAVGVEVKKITPVTRVITNSNVDAVRVKILIPQLSEQDKKNGDLKGSSVKIAIEIKDANGSFIRVVEDQIVGKTMSSYERAYRIELPGVAPWSVRMLRLSENSTDSAINNKTFFSSYTEIIDSKLSYPNTALVGLRIDAKQFDSVPSRAYHVKLLRIKVPSNYNALTRTYVGSWDGTFKIEWSNNPAWCFYDLLTAERYGLGENVPSGAVDKWALYGIGQYCDEMVTDGSGGLEPRFTMNVYLQTRQDAYKLLNDMASVFRGLLYYSAGSIIASQDAPSDPTSLFSNANVIEGEFSYSGSSIKVRHTVALVTWNDLNDLGAQKVEYVEDAAGIAKYGVINTEIVAFGCTSKSQAHRVGRWALLSELTETETVTFQTGLEGVAVAPGSVIKVRDNYRYGRRLGGRVVSVDGTTITLDSPIEVSGAKIHVVGADGDLHTTTVNGDGAVLTMGAAMASPAVRGATWVVHIEGEAPPKDYRVMAVSDAGDGTYRVTALEHNKDKYALIDDITLLGSSGDIDGDGDGAGGGNGAPKKPSDAPSPPTDVQVVVSQRNTAGVQSYDITASWKLEAGSPISQWEVHHRHDDSNPVVFRDVKYATLDIKDVKTGYHVISVRAVNSKGVKSTWTVAQPVYAGSKKVGTEFASASATPAFLAVKIAWTLLEKFVERVRAVEIWGRLADAPGVDTSATNPPKLLAAVAGPGESWTHTDLDPGVNWSYSVRATFAQEEPGSFYPEFAMIAAASANVSDIIDKLDQSFKDSQFYRDLTSRIDDINIPGLDEITELLGDFSSITGQVDEFRDQVAETMSDVYDRVEELRKNRERDGEILLRSVIVDEEVRAESIDGIAKVLDEVVIVQDGLALEVVRRQELNVAVENAEALIITEGQVRAAENEALANQTNLVNARVTAEKIATEALISSEQTARATATEALASDINVVNSRVTTEKGVTDALILTERTARTTADTATANQINIVDARVTTEKGITEALVLTEKNARTTADTATANQINIVDARVTTEKGVTQALVLQEQNTRVTQDTALANNITTLTSQVTTNKADATALVQQESNTRVTAVGSVATSVNNLAARFNNLSGTGQTVESVIINDRNAAANANAGTASSVTGLVTRFDTMDPTGKPFNSVEARVAREEITRATADTAQANLTTQVTARLNNASGAGSGVTVEQNFAASATALGNLQGQWTVKLDNNGNVSGFGLASTSPNGVPHSKFAVAANQFSIAPPSGGTGVVPFQAFTTNTTINGAFVPAGVYITDAFIRSAQIDTLKIAGNAVTVPSSVSVPGNHVVVPRYHQIGDTLISWTEAAVVWVDFGTSPVRHITVIGSFNLLSNVSGFTSSYLRVRHLQSGATSNVPGVTHNNSVMLFIGDAMVASLIGVNAFVLEFVSLQEGGQYRRGDAWLTILGSKK
jgi:predicted phage tail protein